MLDATDAVAYFVDQVAEVTGVPLRRCLVMVASLRVSGSIAARAASSVLRRGSRGTEDLGVGSGGGRSAAALFSAETRADHGFL